MGLIPMRLGECPRSYIRPVQIPEFHVDKEKREYSMDIYDSTLQCGERTVG